MTSLNDYKRHIQVLKMEQKIARMKRELETTNYDDGCPLHGEDDCGEVRKAYDRGYVNGLHEALNLFKLIEADTPQTDCKDCKYAWWNDDAKRYECSVERCPYTQTDCLTCRYNSDEWDSPKCDSCSKAHNNYEPQTDCSWK